VFLLYSSLLALAVLLSSPWWLLQMLRQGKYRAGLRERLGFVPSRVKTSSDTGRPLIWIHAVSVGEALAVSGLVARLRQNSRVVISTTTHTGQKLARERFGAENVFYFPLDFAFAIRPWLDALQPDLVVLAETEFWPNFIRLVHERGVPIVVGNARISDRSLPRYRRFRGLLSRVLAPISAFMAQSEEDARRLREIGAPTERVMVGGNLKFDVTPPGEHVEFVENLRERLQKSDAGPVIVAGSTVVDEEPLVLAAFQGVLATWPTATMILAPRHRERFEEVAGVVEASGVTNWRRSRLDGSEQLLGGILLLDSIGELAAIYGLADLAFVGGSLVPRGGHNILEPAHFGVATIVGPHTENFRDIITLFRRENGVAIASPDTLGEDMVKLLGDDAACIALGLRGQQVLRSQHGATERLAQTIEGLLEKHAEAGESR
jgi:3-deoxy-D-manno-octulosonic-acid transferase